MNTGETTMKDIKESRVVLGLDQHALLTKAATLSGMALATYLRHCALEDAVKVVHTHKSDAE
jgi:uncharacterized protein (DUF1778 family)